MHAVLSQLLPPLSAACASSSMSAVGSRLTRLGHAPDSLPPVVRNGSLLLLFSSADSTRKARLRHARKLREYIDDTEDYINIQLDNHRNQLIQLELFLSSATVALSIYALIAGIFGMNIPYSWNENHGYVFRLVVIISGVASALLFVAIIVYARQKGLVGS